MVRSPQLFVLFSSPQVQNAATDALILNDFICKVETFALLCNAKHYAETLSLELTTIYTLLGHTFQKKLIILKRSSDEFRSGDWGTHRLTAMFTELVRND